MLFSFVRIYLQDNILKPMHSNGWHHHDLSRQNIVRDRSNKLAIIDFGLAVCDCPEGGACDRDVLV
jgi:tRNA A-37 threonylcarbamoyl transferase component Bud32